ncbi:MAG: YfhO family protein [Cellulosilyticaceae bacterium]
MVSLIKNKSNIDKRDLLIIVGYLIIPVLFFLRVLIADIYMVQGDGLGYLAGSQFIKDSIINGEIPLWNRFNASGNTFIGDIQNKFFYPLMWISLMFSTKIGFKLYFIMHLSLGGIFMYFYLRTLNLMRQTSFWGGIVFMFSNLIIIRFEHINIMSSIIWLPLMLLLVEKLINEKNKFYSVFLGIIMGIQFLGGFPQTALYTDIIVFIYYLDISIRNKRKVKSIVNQAATFIGVYLGIVAVQVVPLVELMLFSGRNNVGYEYFSSYSFDIRMLINMIFPTFWGEWASHLNKAIEFPTDIYLGIIVLILIMYVWRFYIKDTKIRLLSSIMIISLLFSCAPQVPYLGQILYKIPIINSFRVLSRALFIFVIMGITLASISLDTILKKQEYKRYLKFSIISFIVIVGMVFAIIGIAQSPIINPVYKEYYGLNSEIYKSTIILSGINVFFAIILICTQKIKNTRIYVKIISVALCLVCALDVYYINMDSSSEVYRVKGIMHQEEKNTEMNSNVSNFLKQQVDINQYRFIVDNIPEQYAYDELVGLKGNNNLFNQLMSMQSYITFENPMYLLINDIWNGKYINTNNSNLSILSMFSNKYIITSKEEKPKINSIISKELIYKNNQPIQLNLVKGEIKSLLTDLNLEKNNNILVELDITIDSVPANFLTVDLYGSNGYDLLESNQELVNKIRIGNNKLSFILNTGKENIPTDAALRIVGYDEKKNVNMTINSIHLSKVELGTNESITKIYEDEEIAIYNNENAKPIIYSPKKVISVDNVNEKILQLNNKENLSEVNYIEKFKNMDLTNVKTDVQIKEINNNSIIAKISTDEDTFINMTQCYYPGWNVYVDGEKSKIYKVNNVIQGVEVPKGTHQVIFKFEPKSLYIGMTITGITILIIIILLKKRSIGDSK